VKGKFSEKFLPQFSDVRASLSPFGLTLADYAAYGCRRGLATLARLRTEAKKFWTSYNNIQPTRTCLQCYAL